MIVDPALELLCMLSSRTRAPIELLAMDFQCTERRIRDLVVELKRRGFKIRIGADGGVYIKQPDWKHALEFSLTYANDLEPDEAER